MEMIEVNVKEAVGDALHYLAALAAGYEVDVRVDQQGVEHLEVVQPGMIQGQPHRRRVAWLRSVHPAWASCGEDRWRPTLDWNQAGELIDQHDIELFTKATTRGKRCAGISGRVAVASGCYRLSAVRALALAELGDRAWVPAALVEGAKG